nr:MAG TPA: hypothetical protein [Caudoviricetes sp.]
MSAMADTVIPDSSIFFFNSFTFATIIASFP